jgi:ABC-type transporter Mla subunit MlaD
MIRRLAALLVVVAASVAALVLTGASDEGTPKRYKVELDNAFGLVEGGDMRVGGVTAGQTTGFEVSTRRDRATALVEIEIQEPGFADFREDARCRVRPQSLIGEYLLDCQPGTSKKKLPEGGTVPVEQTEGAINQDLINNVLRKPYRERFRLILSELGVGLAGRSDDLNEAIRRAHPGLRETQKTLKILGDQNEVIEDFIRDSDTVMRDLAARKRDVARWVREAGETSEISAERREALAAQFERFPEFLDELRPTMARLGELADEQVPLLRDLRRAGPDLTTFFEELGPFANASLPSLRSLGRAGATGSEAIEESSQEIEELRQLAEKAPDFGTELRRFLQTIDDRSRAAEPDPRSAQTSPPAPDKTHDSEGKGFTGMEAILNYIYWQTLAVNQFDSVGHLLRIVAFESPCAAFQNGKGIRYEQRQAGEVDPEVEEVFERCNAWLGPYQPGITAPDPTDDGSRLAARDRREAELARRTGRVDRSVRGPGEPEAPAAPGQRDPSRPQVTLPPGVQELLDRLPSIGRGAAGEARGQVGGAQETQLLDFLLAP